MGVSARYALQIGGLAVALGLTVMTTHAVASADDGTGSPAPGPSSAGSTSANDAVKPPLKAPPQMPTMDLGNGRIGSPTASSPVSSATQAEADEIEDVATMLEAPAPDSDAEFMAEMQDFAAQVNSQMGQVADNPPQRRSQYAG